LRESDRHFNVYSNKEGGNIKLWIPSLPRSPLLMLLYIWSKQRKPHVNKPVKQVCSKIQKTGKSNPRRRKRKNKIPQTILVVEKTRTDLEMAFHMWNGESFHIHHLKNEFRRSLYKEETKRNKQEKKST